MKRFLAPLAVMGLITSGLIGCGPTVEEPVNKPVKPATTETKTEAPHTEIKLENPNRIHQLSTLEKTTLTSGDKKIECWIMDDESKTQEGMMFLTDGEVKENQGMIFAFKDSRNTGFWMHNTLIPLDIIYIDSAKTVVDIKKGKIQDDTSLPPSKKYQYVLELKQGQSERNGIKIGSNLVIPTNVIGKD